MAINAEETKKVEEIPVIDEWETKYKYLAAELENTKKRFQKDMISYKRVITQHVLSSILPVYESIESAKKQLNVDLSVIENQFLKSLENIQVSKLDVKVGDKLDPALHHVIQKGEDSDDTVKEVVRAGWKYEDTVLIPAMVVA